MVARRAASLLLAAALATGLAACGGGDDEDGSDDVELEDVESDASGSSADDGSSDEGDDDAADDEEATDATVDEDVIEGAFSEGCGEFTQVFGALGGAISGAFDPEAAAEFENFVDDAPEEVQDDLETMADAYQDLAALFEEAGFDPEDPTSFDPSNPEALGVLSEAGELFSTPEFLEASENINTFIASNCEG